LSRRVAVSDVKCGHDVTQRNQALSSLHLLPTLAQSSSEKLSEIKEFKVETRQVAVKMR
jgi:hypothetical protein